MKILLHHIITKISKICALATVVNQFTTHVLLRRYNIIHYTE